VEKDEKDRKRESERERERGKKVIIRNGEKIMLSKKKIFRK
jgi:hypothetical protein